MGTLHDQSSQRLIIDSGSLYTKPGTSKRTVLIGTCEIRKKKDLVKRGMVPIRTHHLRSLKVCNRTSRLQWLCTSLRGPSPPFQYGNTF